MEKKERKQKDFFAAMEANILNSLSQGVVPGTPKDPASLRKKSSVKPRDDVGKPELVRTISTMNESVLSNLIQRQPSFRNVKIRAKGSLLITDLQPSRNDRNDRSRIDGFGSFESLMDEKQKLDPLSESVELFSYFGGGGSDIEYSSDDDSVEMVQRMGNMSMKSNGSDAGKLKESSFGLTEGETQALKKLSAITKEMMDTDEEDDLEVDTPSASADLKGLALSAPAWKSKDSKGLRDLPREIDFDDESDSEEDSDSDDDSSDLAPMAGKKKSVRISEPKELPKQEEEDIVRSDLKRRNTCGTIYVGTTMSAPDKDATIKCVCGVIRTHILSSEHDAEYNPHTSAFKVFHDLKSEQNDKTTSSPVPSLDEITRFYRGIFFKAQMETDCIIMSLIYVERLIKRTKGRLRPRGCNWRSLLFSCMILSSKVWDDLSMWNVDFSQSCPPGVSFTLQRINQLELAVLNTLNFQVKVPASEYAKYYFLIRSMLIKSGLGGEEMGSLNPLDVTNARRLQRMSSRYESLSRTKPQELKNRSKSLGISRTHQTGTNTPPKVALEHIVKM